MLDATVLFAGTGWPRWSYEILRHAIRGDFQLVLSPLVIKQARENLKEKAPAYVKSFDDWLRHCPVQLVPDPAESDVDANRNLVRQARDVPVALAAIDANVDCFVSEDKDFTAEDQTTRELHKRLKVMRPVIFLREVMGWSSEDLEKIRHRDWPIEGK